MQRNVSCRLQSRSHHDRLSMRSASPSRQIRTQKLLFVVATIVSGGCASAATYRDLPITGARDHAFAGNLLYVTSGTQLHRFDLSSCTQLSPRTLGQYLLGVDASPSGRYLAVANGGLVQGNVQVFVYDQLGERKPRTVTYPPSFGETGSFMVSWENDSSLLISGSFGGSGWTPLRRYVPATGALTEVRTVTQNTMLSASFNQQVTALAESNISSGPVHVMDAGGNVTASNNTGWFMFEVAPNSDGRRVVAPSAAGAFVLERQGNALVQTGLIGAHAKYGPVSAAFTPDDRYIVTANYASTANPVQQGVMLYDAATLNRITTIDPYPFSWTGNGALRAGRLTLSRDAKWLAVTLNDRVRLYDVHTELGVPAPASSCTLPVPKYEDYAAERALIERVNREVPHTVDAHGWIVPLSAETGK